MSTRTDVKTNLANFKPFEAPRRKTGLREDQISISKHNINLPVSVANRLGESVALLYSDTDKAVAIQKHKMVTMNSSRLVRISRRKVCMPKR
jgi:hypothetical protein